MPNDWTAGRLESIVAFADMRITALRLESLVSQSGTFISAFRLESLTTPGDGSFIAAMRLENIVSSDIPPPVGGGPPPLQGQEQHLHFGLQGHTGGIRKGPGPLF